MIQSQVWLYVYDLSMGMAKVMSPVILDRQINGVWHTGIVVYGQEYFFGGVYGIEACAPGGTVLGQPLRKLDLGTTEVTFDVFIDYLEELMKDRFTAKKYNLFLHNCNTFSSQTAQFLTGRNIPEHITSLPKDVLQTPFGALLEPLVKSSPITSSRSNSSSKGSQWLSLQSSDGNSASNKGTDNSTSERTKSLSNEVYLPSNGSISQSNVDILPSNEGDSMANRINLLSNKGMLLLNVSNPLSNESNSLLYEDNLPSNASRSLPNVSLSSEGNVLSNEGNLLSNEGSSLLNDDNAMSNEGSSLLNDDNAMSNEGSLLSNNSNALSNDDNPLSTNDDNALSNDDNALSNDGNALSNDDNAMSNDDNALSNDSNPLTNDGNSLSNDDKSLSNG